MARSTTKTQTTTSTTEDQTNAEETKVTEGQKEDQTKAEETKVTDDQAKVSETISEGPAQEAGSDDGAADEAAGDPVEAPADPKLDVICHVPGGRRRAGRRWDEGKTTVSIADLTELQVAQLKGDPRFTVSPAATPSDTE